jgi:hypothetical protein
MRREKDAVAHSEREREREREFGSIYVRIAIGEV